MWYSDLFIQGEDREVNGFDPRFLNGSHSLEELRTSRVILKSTLRGGKAIPNVGDVFGGESSVASIVADRLQL